MDHRISVIEKTQKLY
jgi:hypothetical protein